MSIVPAIQPVVDPAMPVFPKDLPFDNGECMDSAWHRAQMTLLIDIVEYQWRDRKDFYCGGNMFVHFSEARARNREFRGPDFFVVLDTDHDRERLYWASWDEDGKNPDVIIELLSPTTANEDLTTKKDVYERTLKTPEFYCYDPADLSLQGWRLGTRRYQKIQLEKGRMYSESLKMWLGTWEGEYQGHHAMWLRFFNDAGELLLNKGEAEAQRADTAEAELARLRQELEQMRNQQSKNGK